MPFSILVRGSIVLAAMSLVGCQPEVDPTQGAKTKASLTVETVTPHTEQWSRQIEASGRITPWEEAIIGAQVSGLPLIAIKAEVGDHVNKGDVLARFDDRTIQAELRQAEAAVVQAKAEARQAQLNKERALKLQGSGTLSEQSVLQYVTGAEVADAGVEQAQAAAAATRLKLSHTVVVAPDSGDISAKTAQLGAVATPGQELFRMVRQGRLEWQAELTSAQLAHVKEGQDAQVVLPEGEFVKGRVRQISPALSDTRMGVVYVDLLPPHSAKAFMYVAGAIVAETHAVVTLPGSSIVVQDGRTHVFVVDSVTDNAVTTVRRVSVELGQRRGELVAVKGLPAETSGVVKQGAGFLSDGDRVKVLPTKSAP